jgi:hypothetical protein
MLKIFPISDEEVWIQALYYGVPCKEYVSTFGRYRADMNTEPRSFKKWGKGYYVVQVHTADTNQFISVVFLHRLIAMTFFPDEVQKEYEVHHKNHDHRDNRPYNLQWMDRYNHSKESARHLNESMLTDDQVDQICRYLVIDKKSASWVARKMNCQSQTIYDIIQRRYYVDQTRPYWDELDKLPWRRKDRTPYLRDVDIAVARGDSRADIIKWLIEKHGLDQQDAEYMHDHRRAIVLGNTKGEMDNDRRYKYNDLVPIVEGMLSVGGEHAIIKKWLMNQGLTPDKAKDLIRQRVKAILENRAHITLDGLEKGIKIMRKSYAKRLEKAAKAKATKDAKKNSLHLHKKVACIFDFKHYL